MYFVLPLFLLLINSLSYINSSNMITDTAIVNYCPPIVNYCPPELIQNTTLDTFNHNFCESRLQNNQPPELYNSYTALTISIVPFICGFPENPLLYNVAVMFVINGGASFYYHYYLTWFGKQADEISMILANYFGLWRFIDIAYGSVYVSVSKRRTLKNLNTVFMYTFIASNTLVKHDYLFPNIFGFYICMTLYIIRKIAHRYNIAYKRYLFVSFTGYISWFVSEQFCNESTVYGHTVWHILFPLGFYQLLLNYDKIKRKIFL